MTVLTIIGSIIGAILVYKFVMVVLSYAIAKFKYEVINWKSYLLQLGATVSLLLAYLLYLKALNKSGDILDPILLTVIGFSLAIYVIYITIKQTNLWFAVFILLFQLISFSVLSAGGIVVFAIAMAFFAETKPVYNIN